MRVVLVAIVMGCLAGAVGGAGRGAAAGGPAGDEAGQVPVRAGVVAYPALASARAGAVIVVGVAGLRWSDVSVAGTPVLASIVDSAAVGVLSARSAPAPPAATCPSEGWLTLGAGGYAAIAEPSAPNCAGRALPAVEVTGDRGVRIPDLPRLYRYNAGLRFGTRPGTLGDAMPCATGVGPGAALAVADRGGNVDRYIPALPAEPGAVFAACPLTVIDLGSLPAGSGSRTTRLADVDRTLGVIVSARPAGSTLLVLGVAGSDGDPAPRLHLAAMQGTGVRTGWLHSPSTRRNPYLQLSDVAPTVLQLLGHAVPAGVAGLPLTGGGPGRPAGVAPTATTLVDLDRAAAAQRAAVVPFFGWYGGLLLAMVGVHALIRRRRGTPRTAAGAAALLLAAMPAGTFLANLVPWWRAGYPPLTAAMVTFLAAGLITAVALLGPWRVTPGRPALVVAAVTAGVLAMDAVTGTTLQIDSMLGYNPLVAGRFIGFGNLAFAVFATASLFAVAAVAGAFRHRRAGAVLVGLAGSATLAVDGAPGWGADFGGVLTLAPAFVVLALLTAGAAVRPVRLLLAGAAGAVVALGIGLLDAMRPPQSRSHFGRFVAGLGDGSAIATVLRKLEANLDLLLSGPHTIGALTLTAAVSVWLVRTPTSLSALYARASWLRPALLSTTAMAWTAFATNDSGVAIPLVVMLVAGPTVLAVRILDRPIHIRPPDPRHVPALMA